MRATGVIITGFLSVKVRCGLRLSWKKGPTDSARLVGIFDLDRKQLLKAGYIRYEPKSEDEVRLRFYHDWNNVVNIQVNSKEQGLPIGRVLDSGGAI